MDKNVPELAVGEWVKVTNTAVVNGVPKTIIEGMAKVIEILEFDPRDNVYYCKVQFKGEDETYKRFIWL
jgi:hypothetical protein